MTDTRTREDLLAEIADLEDKNNSLMRDNSQLNDEIGELQEKVEEYGDPIQAIDDFLNEIDRPVGQFKFIIPDRSSVHRAVLGLYDAIGRKI